MLLRLLPAPSAKQLSPPTILFTLPLATAPYTWVSRASSHARARTLADLDPHTLPFRSKSLPLPPFLLTHRNACAKEGIECSNALLGDKASWIPGIVDEVTFSVRERKINVVLIDGTAMVLPIERECRRVLDSVISEVQLSFAAQQAPPSPSARMSPIAGPSLSRSGSSSSTSSSSSGLRSPSALLSALLSPIMNNVSSSVRPSPPPPNPSRIHRRQARSLLVDAFRQYVLPVLKESLPTTFMLWSLQGELAAKRQEWEEIKAEVDAILVRTGASPLAPVNAYASSSSSSSYGQVAANQRGFKSSSSVDSYDSATSSDSESTPPTTPGTSIYNHEISRSASITPLAHLSTLPACSALPFAQRTEYANYVSRLASLASRLSSIQKLQAMIHKEQGRRSWLESLEASRQVDKAMRRSWSNRESLKGCSGHEHVSRPVRSSPLWESHVENQVEDDEDMQHPAMMMDVDESEEDEEECMSDDDVFSPNIVVRPISPIDISNLFTDVPALVPSSPAGTQDDMDPLPAICARRRSSATSTGSTDPTSMDRLKNRRPSIETMDLSNYRIISTASIDSDEHAGSPSSLLGHIKSTQVHEIPPKAGEAGFRVGVAIVR
jgi:hypothetical protein